jgi:hypothetical protein
LAHSFRGFSPWSLGPFALGLSWHSTAWQQCVVEEAESKETEERGQGLNIPFKGVFPMT